MIVQKEFLNKLKDFGLNTYESKLWTALLSRGISTAGELSDIANVPRSRSYDVLESLEKKGFIIMKLGKPIKYVAVQPSEVLERVKKKVIGDAEIQTKVLDKLKGSEILNELNLLHTQGIDLVEPTDLSGALKGRSNLYNHLESMIKTAESSVDIMTTAEGLIRKADTLKSLLQKAKERKVKIRIAAPLTKETEKAFRDLKGVAEMRNASEIKARFCLVDGKQITFMLLDDSEVHPTYDSGVWVNTPFFASALKQMFETEWNTMKPLETKN
jgi:HTH-type transcriptional regulator, sugar sensing transcriptional regulator